jgi:hypothetical protein
MPFHEYIDRLANESVSSCNSKSTCAWSIYSGCRHLHLATTTHVARRNGMSLKSSKLLLEEMHKLFANQTATIDNFAEQKTSLE